MQGRALVSYTCTSTELGLSLLARNRADVCGVRWGPAEESHNRHAALIQHYPPHKNWVLVRAFQREQGLILAPGIFDAEPDLERLFSSDLRELFGHHQVDPARLTVAARVLSEREVASLLSRDEADVAPGTRSTAGEFGLDFLPIGWEAYDFALDRGVYFRALFQNVINFLKSSECQRIAERFGGYDFSDCGQIVWSA
jgi:molybdate-binding protein